MTVLSVFLSIIFSIQSSFVITANIIKFEGSRAEPEFIQFGQNESGSFKYGVLIEKSEDNNEINYSVVAVNRDSNIYGLKAKVTVTSNEGKFKKTGFITFDKSVLYSGHIDIAETAEYSVVIKICNGEKYTYTFRMSDYLKQPD